MQTQSRRLAVVATGVLAGLGLLAPAASAAPNCLAQVGAAERAVHGTAWGRDEVSQLARNPEQFEGAASLGEVARFIAALPKDACPEVE